MFSNLSKPVNKKLFDIFKACGFVEESGHGVPTVTKVYGNKAYEFDESYVFVTISFKRRSENGESEITQETTKKTIQQKVLELLIANPKLSRNDLAKTLMMKVDSIQYHINQLKKSGKIVRVGADKGGYWEIIKK